MPGERSPRELIEVARSAGVDLSSHASRYLTAADLSTADLVVGFERNHIAAAVVDGGAAYERAFLLRELVRLLEAMPPPQGDDPVERARAAVALAHEQRAGSGAFVPDEEVEDPIGMGRDAYERSIKDIEALIVRMNASLFGR